MRSQEPLGVHADPLAVGTALCGGRFVVEAVLGRGGVATVYRVRTANGEPLALKLMHTARAEELDQRARFENEWRILRGLRDTRCVARALEWGHLDEPDRRPFFTMELLEGPTLERLLLASRLTVNERIVRACSILRKVADALVELHARDVIHRDIKPENIVVQSDGEIRLLDFGYAHSGGAEALPSTRGLTTTEQRPGTYLYMAPEQAIGRPPEPGFDIYALAVTLYEALVGQAPNQALSVAEMARIKCEMREPELSIVGRVFGLPPELEALVDAGLRRVPANRLQTALQFRDRLDMILADLTEPWGTSHIALPASSAVASSASHEGAVHGSRPLRGWGWATPMVLVLVVGALVLLWGRPWESTSAPHLEREVLPVPVTAASPAHHEPEAGAVPPWSVGSAHVVASTSSDPPLQEARPPKPNASRRPRHRDHRRPKPSPSEPPVAPAPDGARCESARAQAKHAYTRGDWSTVIQQTEDPACWESEDKRLSLRLSALYESGRYSQCAALAGMVTDPTSHSIARLCQDKLDPTP